MHGHGLVQKHGDTVSINEKPALSFLCGKCGANFW